ncbi:non-ribosomal peptide synthetase [Salinisphaera aquimarina]|uniref:AMP-binding protein n=1 Tax=Salinisphaera aquimarina TaxID=2094031 RepID=A0ABV7EVP7_9GAMM
MLSFNTLIDALDAQARSDTGESAEIGFIDGASDERRLSYRMLSRAALRLLAVLQHRGAKQGDHVILFVADNLRFLQFFWAALHGGMVPVPIAAGVGEAQLEKLVRVWKHLGQPRVIADAKHLERARAYLEKQGDGASARLLADGTISDEPPAVEAEAVRADVSADDIAFIQFSSGSTGDPKGVVLTHANVLANIRAISEGSRFGDDEVAVSWMPLTHDMGLIGFHLTLVCNGFSHYLMATDLFARRPLLWLEKAAEKQATLLCSPNFGYRHTLRAIAAKGLPALDLSSVRLIYNGAEPIAPTLAREFLDTLAPTDLDAGSMFAVYGLAEASLAATFPQPGSGLSSLSVTRGELGVGQRVQFDDGDSAVELVCLGAPVTGTELRIADADGAALDTDVVGRVWIRGDNVTAGYYRNDAANEAARMGEGWLDTGDLGFLHDGDLFITGRAKEIIFVNGQNHYPQDLEAIVHRASGVEHNKVAAAGVRAPAADADELVLFIVFRGHLEDFLPMAREVAGLINQQAGLAVARVVPVKHMPKTTSGKLQRSQLASAYAAGEFAAVTEALDALMQADAPQAASESSGDVATDLKAICDEVVPDKNIGFDDDLFEIGLSSLELAQIHEGIEQRWPDRLEVTDLFDYPTIQELAAYLEERRAA